MSTISSSLRGVRHASSQKARKPRLEPAEEPRWTWRDWGVIAVVCLASTLLLWLNADSCVFPEDAGTLGQEAERVMRGEIPHVDFDSLYSGGLSVMHAAAFKWFGVRLRVIEYFLGAFGLAFLVAVYAIARRVASPLVAGAVVILCLVWSLPNYFVALPSWYNLFFAAFGTVMLLRHIEDGRRYWLFFAGLCAGCSILFKIIGLYFVAAALLYLVYFELSIPLPKRQRSPSRLDCLASMGIVLGLAAFCLCLVSLVSYRLRLPEVVLFVLPGVLLSGLLAIEELQRKGRGAARRFQNLASNSATLAAGVLVPIAGFAIRYALQGGLGDLWYGILGRSLVRLHVRATIVPLPPISEWIGVLPIALVLLACVAWRAMQGRAAIVVVGLTLTAAALLGFNDPIYQSAWNSARAMTPLLTLAVCWLLGSERASVEITPARRRQLFLLTSAAAMVSLVQVPFAHAIYFFYAAPMVILAGLFYFSNQPRAPRKVGAMLGAAFGVFAFLWLNGAFSPGYGHQFVAYEPAHMEIERCKSLEVDPLSASVYEGLVEVIDQVTAPGSYIYAAPDCPEVYFFTNRRNPTRTFFDLMDEDFGRPERVSRILRRLEECSVDAVVLRPKGSISGFLPRRLHRELVKRYPNAFRIALGSTDDVHFVVRWRDANDQRIATHSSRSSGVEGVP